MAPNVVASRSISTSVVRTILLLSAYIPSLRSHPLIGKRITTIYKHDDGGDVEGDPGAAGFWIYMAVACTLVLLGGVFAGLTLALMGQDEIYLQVIEQSGEDNEKKSAERVLRLLKRGKHWVLVTLLLSNVITNETLPIILDRSLGGGWPAVLASTVLIVIFGEIIPQSVCVRYGLAIGASLSPFVLGLMYLMYPVAYPIALLLDKVLGEDHGTTYKKSGLKTLVTLHKTIGEHPAERLNQDEVTIISAVLDLKDKPVGSIMTPMADVFTMDSETVLDEDTMDRILSEGYSRIPIHAPGEPTNFVGMLLVKILITYDPEDAIKVKDFPLATLPETAPETSCLDIVNFFQQGKSHMVLVSESPGNNYGALGVLTLEDVIEELIGEEIVDESDVYIDVHKAIRRLNPSPIARRSKTAHFQGKDQMSDKVGSAAANVVASAVAQGDQDSLIADGTLVVNADGSSRRHQGNGENSDKDDKARGGMKRKLSGKGGLSQEMVQHLKHLGPSNRASAPRTTTSKNIKIKPGTSEEQVKKEMRDNTSVGNLPQQITSNSQNSPKPSQAAHTMPDYHSTENGTSKSNEASNGKDGKVSPRDRSPSDYFGTAKVRTGSVVERQTEVDGITKVVVETTTSNEDNEEEGGADGQTSDENKKKKKEKKSNGNGIPEEEEDEPNEGTSLLGKKK